MTARQDASHWDLEFECLVKVEIWMDPSQRYHGDMLLLCDTPGSRSVRTRSVHTALRILICRVQSDKAFVHLHSSIWCSALRYLHPRGARGDLRIPPITIAPHCQPRPRTPTTATHLFTLGYLSDSRMSLPCLLSIPPQGRWKRSARVSSCSFVQHGWEMQR